VYVVSRRHDCALLPRRIRYDDDSLSTVRDPEIETRFFEHARDILLVLDAESGRIIDANEAAVAAYGYSLEELGALTVFQLRADPTDVPTQMALARAHGVLFETTHRRRDGSVFDVEVSSRGHVTNDRKLLLSVIRDITRSVAASSSSVPR
jgi:PAS domain S-box-containing protein